jgi:putative spermidine/putrescine transport system permease protein
VDAEHEIRNDREAMRRYWTSRDGVLVLPALALFAAVYLYPLSRLGLLSLFDPTFTVKHYRVLFREPAYLTALENTLTLSVSVTAIALALAYPLAYLMTTVSARTRSILTAFVLVPFWTSILVRTFAWLVILGKNGLVNQTLLALGVVTAPVPLIHNQVGVEIGMVHVLLPFMVLPLYSVMAGIDTNLLNAARSLGAPPIQVFLRVFFPLSLPGVHAGCLLVFLSAVGYYITPALLGGPRQITIAMLIDLVVNDLLNWGFGATLAILLLTAVIVLLVVLTSALGLGRMLRPTGAL